MPLPLLHMEGKGVCVFKQEVIHQLAKKMAGSDVNFLYQRGMSAGHSQQNIADLGHPAAALPCQAKGNKTGLSCAVQGRQNIGAVARRSFAQAASVYARKRRLFYKR